MNPRFSLSRRKSLITTVGIIVAGGLAVRIWMIPPAAPPSNTVVLEPTSGPSVTAPAPPMRPSIEVVRVGEDGFAVVAGRAAPRVDIAVLRDGQPFGSTQSDERGDWVILSERAFGSDQASLSIAPGPDKAVPEPPDSVLVKAFTQADGIGALALHIDGPGAGPTSLLQSPGVVGKPDDRPTLDTVDYTKDRFIALAGHAPPGDALVVQVDGNDLGAVETSPRGGWSLLADRKIGGRPIIIRIAESASEKRGYAPIDYTFDPSLRPKSLPKQVGAAVIEPVGQGWIVARRTPDGQTQFTLVPRPSDR